MKTITFIIVLCLGGMCCGCATYNGVKVQRAHSVSSLKGSRTKARRHDTVYHYYIGADGQRVRHGKWWERNPDTKVIIITGLSKAEIANEAVKKGAFGFIMKPFRIEDVRQIVKNAETELMKDRE